MGSTKSTEIEKRIYLDGRESLGRKGKRGNKTVDDGDVGTGIHVEGEPRGGARKGKGRGKTEERRRKSRGDDEEDDGAESLAGSRKMGRNKGGDLAETNYLATKEEDEEMEMRRKREEKEGWRKPKKLLGKAGASEIRRLGGSGEGGEAREGQRKDGGKTEEK